MNSTHRYLVVALALFSVATNIFSQFVETNNPAKDRPQQQPVVIRPLTHPQGLSKISFASTRSFYKQKSDWQKIIDSTWGQGLPLAQKLLIFDSYATILNNKFDGFLSLGLNWDSLRTHYRSKIDSTTSRGRFAAIMARFSMSLRDGHTAALDTIVIHTPLAPGVPLLIVGTFSTAEHFGAVLTALPDSSALVLYTVPNHPLDLVPGDVILGYENKPWKQLVYELLNADLPIDRAGSGAISSETNGLFRNVGNNWHLFDTIDILKYATKDTLHLFVSPLLALSSEPMMAYEQLQIPGIPFAKYVFGPGLGWNIGQQLSFGKLPGTNIGYIQLVSEWPTKPADESFYQAINALWNTDGLVIDMRWNQGGWALFDKAFAMMFSKSITTIEDAYRAGPTNFNLAAKGNSKDYVIPGGQGSIYDRPIAVLLGPTCVSMGDLTAQRLRYHPMVRFFGKSSMASLGDNTTLTGFPDWYLTYSYSDMFHSLVPGDYLNRKEFPIDEPVWFNPDDVAKGIDPVLSIADKWIKTAAYAYSPTTEKINYGQRDTIIMTVRAYNPLKHNIVITGKLLYTDNIVADSTEFFNDGLHDDGAPNDSIWGGFLNTHFDNVNHSFYYSIRCNDKTAGKSRELLYTNLLTTPVSEVAEQLLTEFALQQNYPNPFNPTTTIRYALPSSAHVKLTIHDILGREIATLVNEEQSAGWKEVQWNASVYASGMYFYQLRSEGFNQTKKLMLMK